MKKINSEEFDNLGIHGRGSTSPFYHALVKLQPSEGLIVYKNEWKKSYPPSKIINRVSKILGYTFEWGALPDRSGWAVKRIS